MFFPALWRWLSLVACAWFVLMPAVWALATDASSIQAFYQTLPDTAQRDMASRIDTISARFVGKPYLLGALGEGPGARYDQTPLLRFDAFDCETFVDTVLALAFSENANALQSCIVSIRYAGEQPDFLTRNHFISMDWNPNNQHKGYIKDITQSILNANGQSVAETAKALIDKPSWYAHLTAKSIRLNGKPDAKLKQQRLMELKSKGQHLPKKEQTLTYLPFSALFDDKGRANAFLFKQIPNGAIVEIVRPNWDLTQTAGTHLLVSHLGFAIWKKGQLYFREASSLDGKVIDIPLEDYLKNHLKSPTIQGINVQVILPKEAQGCAKSSS